MKKHPLIIGVLFVTLLFTTLPAISLARRGGGGSGGCSCNCDNRDLREAMENMAARMKYQDDITKDMREEIKKLTGEVEKLLKK